MSRVGILDMFEVERDFDSFDDIESWFVIVGGRPIFPGLFRLLVDLSLIPIGQEEIVELWLHLHLLKAEDVWLAPKDLPLNHLQPVSPLNVLLLYWSVVYIFN